MSFSSGIYLFLFIIIIIKSVLSAVEMSAGSDCYLNSSREKEIIKINTFSSKTEDILYVYTVSSTKKHGMVHIY